MCRLLAWHSATPVTINQALGADAPNLSALSRIHNDGWGMAYGAAGGVERVREVTPAFESDVFAAAADQTSATDAIVHLRWATESLQVCVPNTHPFVKQGPRGNIAFCHNGGIARGAALTSLIDQDLLDGLEGDTDSEQYFAALITAARRHDGDLVAAYRELLPQLAGIKHSSLNALLLTETDLFVLASNVPANRPESTDEDYYELHWDTRDGVFTAWSSQVRPAGGELLENGRLLQVERASGCVTVHTVA